MTSKDANTSYFDEDTLLELLLSNHTFQFKLDQKILKKMEQPKYFHILIASLIFINPFNYNTE